MSESKLSALLTDLYQLTMAFGYWKQGMSDRRAIFHLFFRSAPFHGGYALAAGLEAALTWLAEFRFGDEDIRYLESLETATRKPLFEPAFLHHLRHLELELDIDALPEGTLVFPSEPILRVEGPLLQCQLVESALLNFINFETLIATKASRICQAADGDGVMEFGLRRAQGIDGAMAASRAAFIGGCGSTSNLAAGKAFGIPVKGTHAHSWVMSFDREEEAFQAYADSLPDNCIFLVDTYDTLRGVERALEVAAKLRQCGSEMLGIRLDSGDLRNLSIQARRMLDDAGFPDAAIVASDDLDEHRIADLKEKGARISLWGVGTRLVTAFDDPALGGVYKLAAISEPNGEWEYRLKLSADAGKTTLPGKLQIVRTSHGDHLAADFIVNELEEVPQTLEGREAEDPEGHYVSSDPSSQERLLKPVLRSGNRVDSPPSLEEIQAYARRELDRLPKEFRRHEAPARFPVILERGLAELRVQVAKEASEGQHEEQ